MAQCLSEEPRRQCPDSLLSESQTLDSVAAELDGPETVHWYLHGAELVIELLHKEMLR